MRLRAFPARTRQRAPPPIQADTAVADAFLIAQANAGNAFMRLLEIKEAGDWTSDNCFTKVSELLQATLDKWWEVKAAVPVAPAPQPVPLHEPWWNARGTNQLFPV